MAVEIKKTIKFKHHNGSNRLPIHQDKYMELLHDANVKRFASNTYSDLIDFIDEHYKQMSKRAKPIE